MSDKNSPIYKHFPPTTCFVTQLYAKTLVFTAGTIVSSFVYTVLSSIYSVEHGLGFPEPKVVKQFHPKRRGLRKDSRRDWEGAEPLLNTLATFALVNKIFLLFCSLSTH
jgi:hypothetical protein